MKKKWSLILAMALSTAIFVTNMSGLTMVVRADSTGETVVENSVGESDPSLQDAATVETVEEKGDVVTDTTTQTTDTSTTVSTETQSQAQAQAEAAKQAALEQAAKEAEEAAAKAAQDAAAQAAKEAAEAAAAQAQAEAEAAQKAADEAKKAAESTNYQISATLNGNPVSKIEFGSISTGDTIQRELRISNTGASAVDLTSMKTNDGDGVFQVGLMNGKAHLEPGESTSYYVAFNSKAKAGTYKAKVFFADANKDPNFARGLSVSLSGTVTAGSTSVSKVSITPSKVTLALGDSFGFTASLSGTGDVSSESVIWSIANEYAAGTVINQNGVLSVAANETTSKIIVTATSVSNPKAKGTAEVTLQSNSYNVYAYADPADGGIVTGGGAVSRGGSVTVSAVPNKNYAFMGWVRDGKTVSTSTNYTVSNVNGNVSVAAKFKQNSITVTAESNINGAGTVVGGGKISYGGKTTLSAKANDGYVFTGWKEGTTVLSTAASLELNNLTSNRKITAVFAKTSHTITLAASPTQGGTVTGGGTFPLGNGTTVTATPASGYAFQGWAVNGQIVSRDASVKIDKIDQDYSFTAVFVQTGVTTFTISAGIATTGGTITPSGKSVVAQGSNVTYTIAPKSGYAILAVAVDNAQVGPVSTYTFTNVQGNHTIAAAFVLTDAGKAAATASGTTTQTEKVQKVEKTETNTATETTTVSLEEAASGEGGDEFVEEMDLSTVEIPTDEELGVYDYTDVQGDNPVLSALGVTYEEATQMIASGETRPILDAAFYVGSLDANVNNTLAPAAVEIDYKSLSPEELAQASDDINPSLPNLDTVVTKLLSNGEVNEIADGGMASVTVSLTSLDSDSISTGAQKAMKEAVGQKPVHYFDLTMLKTVDGYSENISELPEAMEVVVEVPDAIYKSGKTYSVLRVHNGDVTVLPDLDDDPKTVTFRTDRFSTYAIAEQTASTSQLVLRFAIGGAIALAVAIICFVVLMYHQAQVRRTKRKARVEQLRRERGKH